MVIKEGHVEMRIVVPERDRNRFKSVCADQGKRMNEVILELMRDFIVQNGNKND